jgi:nucleoside-diphosphate-sugar epimerase
MNNSNVVIFGAGEISNLLIKELIFRNNKVLCVSDNSFGQINNLSHDNLDILSYKEILNQKLEVDTAIYAWRDSTRLISHNKTILNWIESRNFHANKSFHLSSSSVYKDFNAPHKENCKVLEKNKKLELEQFLTELALKKESIHTNLRISNVYGIDISHGFIGTLFDSIKHRSKVSIFRNLSITRDYVHVNDVIYAIRMLLEIDIDSECINISTGIGTTISQVLEIFAHRGFNFEDRILIEDDSKVKKFSILDCESLSTLINWRPSSISHTLNSLLAIN